MNYGESTIKGGAVIAGFLWPAIATMELAAGSYLYPLAAFAGAYVAGGMRPFWQAEFRQFLHGYLAGGAIYGGSVYVRTDKFAGSVGGAESWIAKFIAAQQ